MGSSFIIVVLVVVGEGRGPREIHVMTFICAQAGLEDEKK